MKHFSRRNLPISQLRETTKGFGRMHLLRVGEHTYGFESMTIHAWNDSELVQIGKYCSIGENLRIILGGGHDTRRISTYPFGVIANSEKLIGDSPGHPVDSNGVKIGNDVWIGMGVTIMGGVQIGNGAVIAANSHVVKDVLDYEIFGGNPALKLRDRFDPKVKEKLLQLSWWDKDNEWVARNRLKLISKPSLEILEGLISDAN